MKDDLLTVAAIGILAFLCTDLAHEVAGHGVGMLLAGGRTGIFTVTRLIHEPGFPDPGWRLFDLGGPCGNLLWAALCFALRKRWRLFGGTAAQRTSSGRQDVAFSRRDCWRPSLLCCFWSSMTFSLLWETGYLMKCGVTGDGDATALVRGFLPPTVWRIILFSAGLFLYRKTLLLAAREMPPMDRTRLLTLCGAAGCIACLGPFFDPRGRMEMLNSGFTTSFLSWIGLYWLPTKIPAPPVPRNRAIVALAILGSCAYVFLLGPGIRV